MNIYWIQKNMPAFRYLSWEERETARRAVNGKVLRHWQVWLSFVLIIPAYLVFLIITPVFPCRLLVMLVVGIVAGRATFLPYNHYLQYYLSLDPPASRGALLTAKRRRYLFVWIVVVGFTFIRWIAPRSSTLSGLVAATCPGIVPANGWARILNSSDADLLRKSLGILTNRKDPVGVPGAIRLLKSHDEAIWVRSALYLGACKREEAVPYLIKSLRHPASLRDSDSAQFLRAITGADFGSDFARWQRWWLANHPDFQFDWDSNLGRMEGLPNSR